MGSERKDKMYSKVMDAIGLIHAENTIIMELIIRCNCKYDEDTEKLIKDLSMQWQNRWEDIRKW